MVYCVDRGPQSAAAAGANLAGVSFVDMFESHYAFNMTINDFQLQASMISWSAPYRCGRGVVDVTCLSCSCVYYATTPLRRHIYTSERPTCHTRCFRETNKQTLLGVYGALRYRRVLQAAVMLHRHSNLDMW
jgi:hypothetical protein